MSEYNFVGRSAPKSKPRPKVVLNICTGSEPELMVREPADVTRLLSEWRSGRAAALDELMPIVHEELKRIARAHMAHERSEHTLQATALVNETFIKLAGNDQINWQDRSHFFAMASKLMRRVLVDHARAQRSAKRGGRSLRLQVDPEEVELGTENPKTLDVLDLEAALEELSALDAAKAELIELRYFGGLTLGEVGTVMGLTTKKVWTECQFAQAWLLRRVSGSGTP